MFIITATVEDSNGVRVDANQPEFLGDAYGREYATEEAAMIDALELIWTRSDYGLDPSTRYEVVEADE